MSPEEPTPNTDHGRGDVSTGGTAHDALWRGGSARAAATLASRATAFFSTILIVNHLGLSGAGQFFLAISVASLAGRMFSFGLPEGVSRLAASLDAKGERKDSERLLLTSLKVAVLASASATACAALVLPWAVGVRAILFSVAIALGGVLAVQAVASAFLRVRGKVIAAEGWLGLVSPVFLAAVVVIISASANPKSGVVFGVRVVIEVAAAALIIIAAFRLAPSRRGGYRVRSLIKSTLPLWLTTLSWLAMNQSDILMLGIFKGTSAVGFYVPILRTAELSAVAFGFFGVYLLPAASRLHALGVGSELQEVYTTVSKITYCVAAPVVVGLAVAPQTLIGGMFHIEGVSLVPAARILAGAYFVNAVLGFNGVTLEATGGLRTLAVRSVGALGATIVSNLFLIPRFGVIGAALGTLIGLLVLNCSNSILLWTSSRITPFRKDMLLTVGASALAAGGVVLAGGVSAGFWVLVALLAGVFAVTSLGAFLSTDRLVRSSIRASVAAGNGPS